jgi:hypothetical protein
VKVEFELTLEQEELLKKVSPLSMKKDGNATEIDANTAAHFIFVDFLLAQYNMQMRSNVLR